MGLDICACTEAAALTIDVSCADIGCSSMTLAQLAERDEHDDELKAEARSAREDAAAARADAAEMAAAAEARVASIDARERAASDKVRRVESEMRALLQEVAQHKRQSQAKVQELMALI